MYTLLAYHPMHTYIHRVLVIEFWALGWGTNPVLKDAPPTTISTLDDVLVGGVTRVREACAGPLGCWASCGVHAACCVMHVAGSLLVGVRHRGVTKAQE